MLWIKSLHIIFVITWFAALFYLPRLFVYHIDALAEGDARGSARFKIMQRKLFYGIMTPSAVLAVAFGATLWLGYGITGGWMHAKFALVLLLLAFHAMCGVHLNHFKHDRNTKSRRYFLWFNEIPTIPLFGGVFLVIFKPF
jgi:protoporphyrinogen IX oxidase